MGLRRYIFTSVGLAACLWMLACGSTSRRQSPKLAARHAVVLTAGDLQTALVGDHTGGPVVLRVGSMAVPRNALDYWMSVGVPNREVSSPPDFRSCVQRLRRSKGGKKPASRPRSTCAAQYDELRLRTAASIIASESLIGEARDLGVTVDESAVQQEFQQSKEQYFPTAAKRREFLRSTGQTTADVLFTLRINQLSDRIYKHVAEGDHPISAGEVAQYYGSHIGEFTIPERRDLRIVRTATLQAAQRARREVMAGRRFASVVSAARVRQPTFSKRGIVLGLAAGTYSEKPLNDAIFSAGAGVLTGPVAVGRSYYVLEVTKVSPGSRRPLEEVEEAISTQLAETQHKHRLAAFVRSYKERWARVTDCAPGYVVGGCKQFKGPHDTAQEDPYTF